MIRRPPRSTLSSSSAASDVYKRQRPSGANATACTALVWPVSGGPSWRGRAGPGVHCPQRRRRSGHPAGVGGHPTSTAPERGGRRERGTTVTTFVTGGTGFIGSAVVAALVAAGEPVQALTRSSHSAAAVRLSLIHISEPTRLLSISYAVFCLK